MSYRVERQQTSQVSGHLVIANHPTLIDALFVLAYIDNLCCVVKPALCSNPFTRLTVRLAGYIASDSEALIDLSKRKLDAGENLLIFPEGTRNEYDTQLDFKRGAANIAVVSGCPILPVVIGFSPRALQKHEKWYKLPSTKSKILIRITRSLELQECVDRSLPRTVQYRRLTQYFREFYLKQIALIK
jgi:1-acyl-sn-glycerol-3-phosphate acyltransferase